MNESSIYQIYPEVQLVDGLQRAKFDHLETLRHVNVRPATNFSAELHSLGRDHQLTGFINLKNHQLLLGLLLFYENNRQSAQL
jgi:hypothetical protein